MVAFNVFRSKLDHVWCAVPEGCAVPSFVYGESWVYDRKLDGEAVPPTGFIPSAAAVAMRFNGFYLFQPFDCGSIGAPSRPLGGR